MNNFLKKIIEGNGIIPPEVCQKSFDCNFNNAINTEWYKKEEYFEAVFYKENSEYIAIFDESGDLLQYKQFLPNEFLPETIKKMLEIKGEIMNVVLRNKRNTIEYEVIIRDPDLNRFLLILSDIGIVLDERLL